MFIKFGAGLVICLAWNIISVTAAWIRGEGQLEKFGYIFMSSLYDEHMVS